MRETFDFENNKVENITLDELKRTYKEDNVLGMPLRGKYHFEVIEAVLACLNAYNYNTTIKDLFAAQNKDSRNPGVVINPILEEKYGKKSIEAHVLRRVYTNINVSDFDNEELTTNVVVAFHQDAVEIAYGRNVKICTNQCILSPARVLKTNRQKSINDILAEFNMLMKDLRGDIEADDAKIERMKEVSMTEDHIFKSIGVLNSMRVLHDTKDKLIKRQDDYPLSQSQLTVFTEDVFRHLATHDSMSLWDFYNVATNLYKPTNMEISNILPQQDCMRTFMDKLLIAC